jgi:hypothetical protein
MLRRVVIVVRDKCERTIVFHDWSVYGSKYGAGIGKGVLWGWAFSMRLCMVERTLKYLLDVAVEFIATLLCLLPTRTAVYIFKV